jgi:glyoxylase-like metal-dependent hydrolase (beta-lactamase superfamily II)
MTDSASRIAELRQDVYLIKGEKPGSHVYLIKGSNKNVLIDTGITSNFPYLKLALQELGLKPRAVHLIILTHEHFDHIGTTGFFFGTSVVAAHRLAANKIELQDEFVTLMKYCNAAYKPFRADIWLEEGSLIDLGNYKLHVFHTPGHTSGCICLYEARNKLLFSGDTIFGGGALSGIASSGSISDYMNSLQRLTSLRVQGLYSGHGRPSEDPEGDILRGLERARALFDDTKMLFDTLAQRMGKQKMVERTLNRLAGK